MTLTQLRRNLASGQAPEAEVISVEGMIYLVRIDAEHMLTASEEDSAPLRFPSAYAAGRALQQAGLGVAWLVHHSPYDEMVGRADEGLPQPKPLRTRMAIAEL